MIFTYLNDTDDVEAILSPLDSAVPLRKIAITSETWNWRFFESLSQRAPFVVDVRFSGYRADSSIMAEIMTSVASTLPNFKRIQKLDLTTYSGYMFPSPASPAAFFDDYDVLQSWSRMCPTLELCCLPNMCLQWALRDGKIWVPDRQNHHTWSIVRQLPAKDLWRFPWLGLFVKQLCENYGLSNPFDDVRSADMNHTCGLAASIVDEADDGDGDNSGSDDEPSDSFEANGASRFLHRVRISLQHAQNL